MLLTQKPQPINFSRHHRRHPASLSNIVPHPTSTPGLLSLTKPPIRQPSRPHQRPQSPRFPPRSRFHRSTTSITIADLPSNAISTLHSARGRPQIQVKVETEQPRLASQVSPPNTPVAVPESTPPLPFPPSPRDSSLEPPTLSVQPTGRLARRRTRHKSTPAVAKPNSSPERTKAVRASSPPVQLQPSAPIPVPERRRNQSPTHKTLSRSDPLSKLTIHTDLATSLKPGRKDKRRKNKVKPTADGQLPLAEWDFPAPGDSDDEGEDDEPMTPTRQTGANDKAWYNALRDGPKTAPLQPSATQGQFPFFTFPSRASPLRTRTPGSKASPAPITPNRQSRPEHRRAPSQPASLSRATAPEGMFHLSEDEADVLPAGAAVHAKMALLFGTGNNTGSGSPLFPSTGTPSPSPRKPKLSRERDSVDGATRQLFASSSFQIAPEPVELPKPSFLLGVRA